MQIKMHEFKFRNVFVLLLLFISYGISNCYSEDYCNLKNTGLPGICTPLNSCHTVSQDLKIGKRDYTLCFQKNRDVYVCCPTDIPKTTTVKPTTVDLKDISVIKCHEYAAAVYVKRSSITLVGGSLPNESLDDKCGHKTTPLIYGGELASSREFPHMALVGYGKNITTINWRCGGTLISDRYILTAAHCIDTELGTPTNIRLGELNFNSKFGYDVEDFAIESTIVHPEYKPPSQYNDIALIKLDQNVKLNPYKRPACLPTKYDTNDNNVIATGWGKTERLSESGHLQKVTLEKFTQENCNAIYFDYPFELSKGIVYDTQICAGSKSKKKDTCQGDSGGPIQIFHPTEYCMYQIVGVTSLGEKMCGRVGIPGIYTRVYPYVDWIKRIIWE